MPKLTIEKLEQTYIISINPSNRTKYWCWAYINEQTAQHVINCLEKRWIDCPVKKYEDFTNVFVTSKDNIILSDKIQEQIKYDWTYDPINIQRISG